MKQIRQSPENSHFGEQINQLKCILETKVDRPPSAASLADWPMILTKGVWTEEKRTISGPQNWKMCPGSLHAPSLFMWARWRWWQLGPGNDGRASGYKELRVLNCLVKGSHSLPGTLTSAYICWVEFPVLYSSSLFSILCIVVYMWELDCEESWALKNRCFWSMVLEKTLESPLDCKEIQPVHPEGDQSWVFIGRSDVEAETPVFWPPHVKCWLIGKDPDAGRDWGQEKGMAEDEMAGWPHRLDGHEFESTLGVGDGQGGLVCCDSWGRKELDTTEWLYWTECICVNPDLPIYPFPFDPC